MEKFTPEIKNNVPENKEGKESPESKHKKWKECTKTILEGAGLGAAFLLAVGYISKQFGLNLDTDMVMLASNMTAITYVISRLSSYKEKDDDKLEENNKDNQHGGN